MLIDGHDVRTVRMSALAELVGMVTQETFLFHATIADNLRYAAENASDDELREAARKANIHERIVSFEAGVDRHRGRRPGVGFAPSTVTTTGACPADSSAPPPCRRGGFARLVRV